MAAPSDSELGEFSDKVSPPSWSDMMEQADSLQEALPNGGQVKHEAGGQGRGRVQSPRGHRGRGNMRGRAWGRGRGGQLPVSPQAVQTLASLSSRLDSSSKISAPVVDAPTAEQVETLSCKSDRVEEEVENLKAELVSQREYTTVMKEEVLELLRRVTALGKEIETLKAVSKVGGSGSLSKAISDARARGEVRGEESQGGDRGIIVAPKPIAEPPRTIESETSDSNVGSVPAWMRAKV
jgi:hypothetical protein